jgi:DNA modification methylase
VSLGSAQIIQGNALALPLADSSVDLVCTSPPYFGLRSYQDGGKHYAGQIGSEATPAEFVDALIAATREMVRVLKPSGSIWVNLGDKYSGTQGQTQTGINGRRHMTDTAATWRQTDPKRTGLPRKSLMGIPWRYAIRCIDELRLILRAEVIWSKPNGLPESVADRVRRSHEQWFHFVAQPRYFSAVDEIREAIGDYGGKPQTWEDRKANGEGPRLGEQRGTTAVRMAANPLGKLPGSVWTVPTQPLTVPADLGIDHFAAFPMEWPRRIIRAWSPPGATVLDPFGGTGTTALVAKALGRQGVSVDLSFDYCRLAKWRTCDPGQIAAALEVEKPEAVADGQLSLFEVGDGAQPRARPRWQGEAHMPTP